MGPIALALVFAAAAVSAALAVVVVVLSGAFFLASMWWLLGLFTGRHDREDDPPPPLLGRASDGGEGGLTLCTQRKWTRLASSDNHETPGSTVIVARKRMKSPFFGSGVPTSAWTGTALHRDVRPRGAEARRGWR